MRRVEIFGSGEIYEQDDCMGLWWRVVDGERTNFRVFTHKGQDDIFSAAVDEVQRRITNDDELGKPLPYTPKPGSRVNNIPFLRIIRV